MINNIKINNSYFIVFLIIIIISTLYINTEKKNIENNDGYNAINRDIFDKEREILNNIVSKFIGKIYKLILNKTKSVRVNTSRILSFSRHYQESKNPESNYYKVVQILKDNKRKYLDNIINEILLAKNLKESKYFEHRNDLETLVDYHANRKNYDSQKCLGYIIYYIFIHQLGVFFKDIDLLVEKLEENNVTYSESEYSDEAIREIINNIFYDLNNLINDIYKKMNPIKIITYKKFLNQLKSDKVNLDRINTEIIKIIRNYIIQLLYLYERNGMKENTFINILSFNIIFSEFKKFMNNYLYESNINDVIYPEDKITSVTSSKLFNFHHQN